MKEKTMRVKFLGGTAVEVPELGQGTIVDPGEIVEVPDDIGARMVESAIWQATTKPKASQAEKE